MPFLAFISPDDLSMQRDPTYDMEQNLLIQMLMRERNARLGATPPPRQINNGAHRLPMYLPEALLKAQPQLNYPFDAAVDGHPGKRRSFELPSMKDHNCNDYNNKRFRLDNPSSHLSDQKIGASLKRWSDFGTSGDGNYQMSRMDHLKKGSRLISTNRPNANRSRRASFPLPSTDRKLSVKIPSLSAYKSLWTKIPGGEFRRDIFQAKMARATLYHFNRAPRNR